MMGIPETRVVKSAADLSSYEYVAVKYASGGVELPIVALCGANEVPEGFIIKGEIAGRPMEMITLNGQPCKGVASAAIAVTATCKIAANGQLVATTTDGDRYFFIATEVATAAGDKIAGYTVNAFRGA